jgi:sugar/nucleoside kinase (ribokinase family)
VKIDVAVVGAPFLDLTFGGLPRLPGLGEEILARSLHVAPGGTGMQAIAAARLGLASALVAPLGRGGGAGLLRGFLESEGVEIVADASATDTGAGSSEVPTTALLATSEGVAMATVLQGREPTAEEVSGVPTRAVMLSLGRLALAPTGVRVYAATGGLELDRVRDAIRDLRGKASVVIVNAAEATSLTGRRDPEEAGLELARFFATVVVTMGRAGALGVEKRRVVLAPAPDVDVVDATGAGDLFTAAYVWADLHGAALEDRLAWASLYAGLSVRAPTAYAGREMRTMHSHNPIGGPSPQ